MRLAAFNVENLFDRAKVFNSPEEGTPAGVLDAFSELNILMEKEVYTDAIKARMLELLSELGMLHRGMQGEYVRIRKIRGVFLSVPRRPKQPYIKASGRDSWIGWAELKTEAVDEDAMFNTARMIMDLRADVLAIVEAESRPVLQSFQKIMQDKLGLSEAYRHIMLIDGNDPRGIDVGLATREGYPIGNMRSHADDLKPDGFAIFSRDCPEYELTTEQGNQLVVLPNHFKSKFGGNDAKSKAKRLAQSTAVAEYYDRLKSDGFDYIAVLGDLNDTPDSDELAPLLQNTDLKDVSDHPNFTAFEFNANNGHRGIGTHGLGNDNSKIDYLLLSPALYDKVLLGGIERRGIWPGSNPPRWEVYPELKHKHQAASDHHAIWADLDI